MKLLIFASLFLTTVICNKTHTVNAANNLPSQINDTTTIAGNWQLLPVLASDTAAGKIPQLNFNLTTKRFSGNTGCNALSGNFIIKNDALSFGANMISTKMACPGYNEKTFLDNLLKTNRFEIKNGVLQLMYNTTILSKWIRKGATVTKQI